MSDNKEQKEPKEPKKLDVSQVFIKYAGAVSLLKKNPEEAIKYLSENKQLFNITDAFIEALKKEYNLTDKNSENPFDKF
jgi:hypothetical protein